MTAKHRVLVCQFLLVVEMRLFFDPERGGTVFELLDLFDAFRFGFVKPPGNEIVEQIVENVINREKRDSENDQDG